VSQSLSRAQAVMLGLVVVATLVLGGYGIARIADKQGVWADTVELTAGFPEAHDITPGTPVRIRGVDAGQVVAVEYPDHDEPGAEVTVRMRVQAKYASRIYADATAQVHNSGLLGSKVISLQPGEPKKGALADSRVKGVKPFDMNEAVAEVRDLAKEAKSTATEVKTLAKDTRETVASAKGLIEEVKKSDGTLAKLIRDDDLYEEARGTITDMRKLIARTDKSVGKLDGEVTNLHDFISDGRDTLRSVKQNSDAVSKMPIVRSYVEDSTAILVRPTMSRERWPFQTHDLFEPGTATLTPDGAVHLNNMANILKVDRNPNSEVVIVAYCDPADQSQTTASALELTRKQAETVMNHLKVCGVHKMGLLARRKITPLGMGTGTSPVVETEKFPPSHVEVMLFAPR
jgi:phospholipid/cholesterol/gamma-HCH transport system substrate-binding protein